MYLFGCLWEFREGIVELFGVVVVRELEVVIGEIYLLLEVWCAYEDIVVW